MSDTRVKDIQTAKKLIREATDDKSYIDLVELNDPLLALTMIDGVGSRLRLGQIQINWKNHEGKSISGSLLMSAVEIATSEMSYEEIIKFFLNYNAKDSIKSFAGPFILKKMKNDPDFLKALQNDEVLAPILFCVNPKAAAMMQDGFVKPLSAASDSFLLADKIVSLGFSPNSMTPFEEDIVTIQMLLSNQESMLRQLDILEKELNKNIQRLNPAIKLPLQPLLQKDSRLFTKPYAKDPNRSFLFDFFHNWALKNGFQGMTRLTKEQTDQQFMQNLIDTLQFKDVQFDREIHGAWTHVIQWYCIVSAYNNGQLHLHHSPADLYREIGKKGGEKNEIWDKTFETPTTKIKFPNDFRDVDLFHDFLLKDPTFAQRCPTIQSLLYYRALKGEEKQSKPKPGT